MKCIFEAKQIAFKDNQLFKSERLQRYQRFASAGLANTLIGSTAILGLQALTGSINTANTLGYLLGSICGYYLHASYTFKASITRKGMAAYAATSLISFAVNLSVLNTMARYFNPYLSQIAAIVSFIVSSYLLQSRLVFKAYRSRK